MNKAASYHVREKFWVVFIFLTVVYQLSAFAGGTGKCSDVFENSSRSQPSYRYKKQTWPVYYNHQDEPAAVYNETGEWVAKKFQRPNYNSFLEWVSQKLSE